jgi:cell division protein FtsL
MRTPNAIRRLSARVPMAIWPIALLCAVATAWGLTHVWVRLQLISVGYEISRQHQVQHDLMELTQRLSLELRTRTDLGTIERIARERLQMAPPDARAVHPITLAGQDR